MVIAELTPIREKINDFMTVNKSELEGILREGADKAEYQAQKTLRKMQKKVGLVPPR